MSNWSELPRDLLVEIVAHIKMLEDFIAFGAVCKGWCAAGKKEYFKGLWLWQRTPYLMLPVRDDSDDNAREFYSLVEGEIVESVRIPKFKERRCHESLGWLLAIENDGNMCLLDPFSSVEIPVPHQSTFPEYESVEMDEYIFVQRFVLSARPNETSDFIVMIIGGGLSYLAFWRPGDESWNRIGIGEKCFRDVMYFGGHFYAINGKGCVWDFTLEGDNPPTGQIVTQLIDEVARRNWDARNIGIVYPDCRRNVYIDELVLNKTKYILKTSRSMFMITRNGPTQEDNGTYHSTSKIWVYEVDMSAGTWTEINNIGNMAIFIGHNATFAVDTSRFIGKVKANHIYFSDDGLELNYSYEEIGMGKDMGAYNLETGTIESFYSGDVLLSKTCMSIWITPSFS